MDDAGFEKGTGLNKAQFWHYFRRYPYILAKIGILGLVVLAIYALLQSVQSVLFPIFMSLLIAYLLDPLVDKFEERKISRTLAIMLFLTIGLGAAALFVVFLYPTIAKQSVLVWERLPQIAGLAETRLFPWLESMGIQIPSTVSEALAEHGNSIKEGLPAILEQASKWTAGLAAKTGPIIASLLYVIMIPIFTFYFLRDFDTMKPVIVDLIPLHRREFVLERLRRADVVVGAWFRGQVEVAMILGVLYAIGLGAVFGFADIGITTGVAIGLLSGILAIIPYFGFFVGFGLSVLLVLLDWHGIWPLVGVCTVFIVIQLFESYLITPRIVGDKVGLSPVVVIIVLLLGGEMMGLLGVLLAIPVAGVFRVLLPDIIEYYKSSPYFTGSLPYQLGNAEPVTAEKNDPAPPPMTLAEVRADSEPVVPTQADEDSGADADAESADDGAKEGDVEAADDSK